MPLPSSATEFHSFRSVSDGTCRSHSRDRLVASAGEVECDDEGYPVVFGRFLRANSRGGSSARAAANDAPEEGPEGTSAETEALARLSGDDIF